jgi:acetyl-CoA carboxylase, biotin carboxylase subunit
MFKKVLIANRGEIAVRVIRACRELGIPTVAIYSLADEECLHVRMADEAVCVGPPPPRESYGHIANVISAAVITGCDAVHPGYGFLAENASFAEASEACGVKFIGPRPDVIRRMGDKAEARDLVKGIGGPIVPGTGIVESESEAAREAERIGLPVMVKAAAGGGGKGMRVVHSAEELAASVKLAQAEAASAFGNSAVYLEKYIEEPRHVEIQVAADEHGNVIHLGERDCSLQTARHQKMLEEAPCVALTPALRSRMGQTAVKIARAAGYSNVGTIEFLLDRSGHFYFMEMNTRVQVEHPVTELVTGVDIVKLQFRVAAGEKLGISQKEVKLNGHAIECRITAEDPARKFAPSAGTMGRVILPGGFGVRVDSHIYSGYTVPTYYDSLLAKLLVWGANREEAIARMARALDETQIEGIETTIPFHKRVMQNAWFRRGEVYTNFIHRRVLSEE